MIVLFRDTPHAYIRSLKPDGHMAIYGHIWPFIFAVIEMDSVYLTYRLELTLGIT